jgi:hypothetical protein
MIDKYRPHKAVMAPGGDGTEDMRTRLVTADIEVIDCTK